MSVDSLGRKSLDNTANDLHSNIVKGIFNSNKGNLIQNVASIPCNTIETLQSDADEAEQFVEQLQAGQVPSIIANLPEEAVSEFGEIIGVATEVIDVAEAAVTDVINIFNDIEDGSIVSDIEGIPTDIINAITNGWNDFTDDIKTGWDDFTCWIDDDCSSSSLAGFCSMPASASATATPDAGAASSSAAAAAAYTSEFYASESSAAAAAAAYTSEFYASESSAGAAYTSAYYSSYASGAAAYTSAYYSSYYASESSAEAAGESASSVDSAANADRTTADTMTNANTETQRQTTTPTSPQNPAPGGVQSNSQITTQSTQAPQPTQSPQESSMGSLSFEFDRFNHLALAGFAVLAVALWL